MQLETMILSMTQHTTMSTQGAVMEEPLERLSELFLASKEFLNAKACETSLAEVLDVDAPTSFCFSS